MGSTVSIHRVDPWTRVRLRQGLRKIRLQILSVFNPHRQPDQGVVNSCLRSLRRCHGSVRSPAGNADQSLYASQAQSRCGNLELRQKRIHSLGTLQLKGKHPAKAAHLTAGKLVVGMVREAGLEDERDGRMRLKKAREAAGFLVVLLDSEPHRLQAAFQLIASVGIE